MGWSRGRSREARILGRIITLTDEGAIIEPDPALLEEVVHLLGMEGAASTVTPAVKDDPFEKTSSAEVTDRKVKAQDRKEEANPGPIFGAGFGSGFGCPDKGEPLDEAAKKLYISVGALLN